MNSVQRLGVAEGVGGRKGLLSFSWIYVYLAFCEKKNEGLFQCSFNYNSV